MKLFTGDGGPTEDKQQDEQGRRHSEALRLGNSTLLKTSKQGNCDCKQVCLHGRVVTCLVLSLVSGAYLTASSSLATISASTSCELPPQLVLPLADPMIVVLLTGSVLNLTMVQHTANDLQHEFVITRTQKVNPFLV